MLGRIDSTSPVVRIDVQASGCQETMSAVAEITTKLLPGSGTGGAGSVGSPFEVAAKVFAPDGTVETASVPFDVVYQQDGTSGLWLGIRARPMASCTTNSGGTSFRVSIITTPGLGAYTAGGTPSGGSWQVAEPQFVGQEGQLALDQLESSLGCAAQGLVYSSTNDTCVAPSQLANGPVTEVVNTIAVPTNGGTATVVAMSVPSIIAAGPFGIAGRTTYECNQGGGSLGTAAVAGEVFFSATQSASGSPSLSVTPVGSTTTPPLSWTLQPVDGQYNLMFSATAGQECLITSRS